MTPRPLRRDGTHLDALVPAAGQWWQEMALMADQRGWWCLVSMPG